MLYQSELAGDPAESVIAGYFSGGLAEGELSAPSRRFAEHLVRGVRQDAEQLDGIIRQGSAHWRIERMAAVDRNVLRLAVFDLMDDPQNAAAVIRDEDVELTNVYGGEESGAIVNGLLDGIRLRREQGEIRGG